MRHRWPAALPFVLGLAGSVGVAHPARASGAFFAPGGAAVVQAGEQILFADNGDGTTTAVIQVQYQGPAERFAWLLPVLDVPEELAVSDNVAFDRLAAATAPRFQLDVDTEGQCFSIQGDVVNPETGLPYGHGVVRTQGQSEIQVSVAGAGIVGEFEWTVISVDAAADERAAAAVAWLVAAGYEVPSDTAAVLAPYLANDMHLLALRLQTDTDGGAIRPIVIRYPGKPTVPIRPTALAARDDLGLTVYLIGAAPGTSLNYPSLELNEAALDWFSPAASYDDLVRAAIGEAGGHGFVTELSRPIAELSNLADETTPPGVALPDLASLWTYGEDAYLTWDRDVDDPDEQHFFSRIYGVYSGYQGFRAAVEAAISVPPEGPSLDEILECCGAPGSACPPDCAGGATFSRETLFQQIEERIARPMRLIQGLVNGGSWITRLYTRLSPSQMTLDPDFAFNPDLPRITQRHDARMVIECNPRYFEFEAPYRVELPGGGVLRVGPHEPGWPRAALALPANRRILRNAATGRGEVIRDNTREIGAVLDFPDDGCGMSSQPNRRRWPLDGAALLALWVLSAARRRTVARRFGVRVRDPWRR